MVRTPAKTQAPGMILAHAELETFQIPCQIPYTNLHRITWNCVCAID